jgi:16S rRNA (guanine527-N7)-methyltransferase
LCAAELGLGNVEVVRGRAEDLAGHLAADVVTARAVAPLDKLAGLCVGIARPGGRIVAMKGASAEAELARARPVLGRLGISDARVLKVGSAQSGSATVVMFSAPEHRSDRSAPGRGQARGGSPMAGPMRGKASYSGGPGGGRKSRPNSRRSGG